MRKIEIINEYNNLRQRRRRGLRMEQSLNENEFVQIIRDDLGMEMARLNNNHKTKSPLVHPTTS